MRILIVLGLLAVAPAFCDTFSFTVDTSTLIGNPNGPFTLDFQFNDGSGTNDGNNTVTVSNFTDPSSVVPSFEAGGVALAASPLGFTMTDSSFLNEISFTLSPDSSLGFTVVTTNNPDSGTPDSFIVDLLDRVPNNILTTNPNNGIALIEIDLPTTSASSGTQVITSASLPPSPFFNNDDVVFAAPAQSIVSTPEPSSLVTMTLGVMVLFTRIFFRRFRSKRLVR